MVDENIVYGFLFGLYAGRFTNMFSNTIITGLVMYFYQPEIYTYSTLVNLKETTVNFLLSLK